MRHLKVNEAYFFARFLRQRGYTATLRERERSEVDAFRAQVESGLEKNFFQHFSPVSIQV